MAASTLTTTTFSNDTDAHFRTWVAAIIAAIVAGGWVQTSDTGQINTSTVLAPVAINTVQGYAIFRSNDTGGSLNEYYVKLEFGSGGTSALRPSVWITVGWATDGAGNIVTTTYPSSTRTQVTTNANPSGVSMALNFASGSGYFCICGCNTGPSENMFFSVERTLTTALAFQNQILVLGCTSGQIGTAGVGLNQTIDRLNAWPIVGSFGLNTVSMPPNANTPVGGTVGLGLVFGMAPGATSPSMNILGVEAAALGLYQDTITVPILGSNHNYKLQQGMVFAANAGTVALSRFE